MIDPRVKSHKDKPFSHASGTMPSSLRIQRQTNRTGAPKAPVIMLVTNMSGENAIILDTGRNADFDLALKPSRCATSNNTRQTRVESINHAMVVMARN